MNSELKIDAWIYEFISKNLPEHKSTVDCELDELISRDDIIEATKDFAIDHWEEYEDLIKQIRKELRKQGITVFKFIKSDFNGRESYWYYNDEIDLDVEEIVFWRYLFEKCYDVFERKFKNDVKEA